MLVPRDFFATIAYIAADSVGRRIVSLGKRGISTRLV